MKQEDKDLLLQDLCSRLPYGVKIQAINPDHEFVIEELSTISVFKNNFDCNLTELYEIKPYLFPLSSMTEEQKNELINKDLAHYCSFGEHDKIIIFHEGWELIDWLNSNHFDYRGLIEKELAIDATGLNIY